MRSKMSLQTRKELISSIRLKYKGSFWKEKNKILNGFVAATGYQRKYAIGLLNTPDSKGIEKNSEEEHQSIINLFETYCS